MCRSRHAQGARSLNGGPAATTVATLNAICQRAVCQRHGTQMDGVYHVSAVVPHLHAAIPVRQSRPLPHSVKSATLMICRSRRTGANSTATSLSSSQSIPNSVLWRSWASVRVLQAEEELGPFRLVVEWQPLEPLQERHCVHAAAAPIVLHEPHASAGKLSHRRPCSSRRRLRGAPRRVRPSQGSSRTEQVGPCAVALVPREPLLRSRGSWLHVALHMRVNCCGPPL